MLLIGTLFAPLDVDSSFLGTDILQIFDDDTLLEDGQDPASATAEGFNYMFAWLKY